MSRIGESKRTGISHLNTQYIARFLSKNGSSNSRWLVRTQGNGHLSPWGLNIFCLKKNSLIKCSFFFFFKDKFTF